MKKTILLMGKKKVQSNNNYKVILNILVLGISIFSIEYFIQFVLVIFESKYAFEKFTEAILNKSFDFKKLNYLLIDTNNIFYFRLAIYLIVWLIAFKVGFKFLIINNLLVRLICFNFLLMIFTSIFIFPLSLLLFFSPPFYKLIISIVLTPLIIYSLPYFRNFLKSYVEEGTKNEINFE